MLPVFIAPPQILQAPWPVMHRVHAAAPRTTAVKAAQAAPKKSATKKPTWIPKTLPTGPWAAGQWDRFPASVERSARCIAHHESWHAGLWRARYRGPVRSDASGFAQWLGSSWRTQAKRAGIGTQYRAAYLAPPAIQAAVFAYQAQHYGLYPWNGTNCPGT